MLAVVVGAVLAAASPVAAVSPAAITSIVPAVIKWPILLPYTTLETGLGAPIGSHFVKEENRLYFVEYTKGRLSSFDVVPRLEAKHTLSGVQKMLAGGRLNLRDGSASGGHIRWYRKLGTTAIKMYPEGSDFKLAALGNKVNYWGLTPAYMHGLAYSSAGLSTAQLQHGMTFAVKNAVRQPSADFDYAKVYVSSHSSGVLSLLVTTYQVHEQYKVHGTGYHLPEDFVIASSGLYGYLSERGGSIYRVDMSAANKGRSSSAVSVLTSGLTSPQQLSLNDDDSVLYAVEYGPSGRLLAVDVATTALSVLKTGLDYPVGLVTRNDGDEAFISLQGTTNKIMHFVASTGTTEFMPFTLPHLFFMTWADDSKQEFFVPQRVVNKIHRVAVNAVSDAQFTTLSSNLPSMPSSVAVVSSNHIVVCTNSRLIRKVYASGLTASGPLLMGIGHVPKTSIKNGYATTSPGYFFQVKDAPFGSVVNVMINHAKARSMGARWYRIRYGGVLGVDGFTDYKWDDDKFKAVTTAPSSQGFFPVRKEEDVWYNANFGYRLDTRKATGGLKVIQVWFYSSASTSSYISGSYESVAIFADNTRPTAKIAAIHQIVNGVKVAIPPCGIVEGSSDEFSFDIEAKDSDGNLKSWTLWSVWGDNKSGGISSDTYSPSHVVPSKKWFGGALTTPAGNWHATVAGDPSSRRCARTFLLRVWDRAINGYNHIHRTTVTKSVTFLLS